MIRSRGLHVIQSGLQWGKQATRSIKIAPSVTLPAEKKDQAVKLESVFSVRPDRKKGALNFATSDYLGLANHPKINEASARAVIETGGVSWNRTATMPRNENSPILHMQRLMAKWLGSNATIYMKSGNDANIGLLDLLLTFQKIPCYKDVMTNHAINRTVGMTGVTCHTFNHNDAGHLKELMTKHGQGVVVTESINGYLGTVAPLREIVAMCQESDSAIYIEESHAIGVYGRDGAGLCHELGIAPNVHLRVADFGHAFGSIGGICAMNEHLANIFHSAATMSIFSREAEDYESLRMLCALEVYPEERWRANEVLEKSYYFRNEAKNIGYKVPSPAVSTPIVPFMIGEESQTIEVYNMLKERNVFPGVCITPVARKDKCFLRFLITQHHTKEDLDSALKALKDIYSDAKVNEWIDFHESCKA